MARTTSNAGFSLTEIILVVSLMAVLFAIIVASINNYAARQAFTAAVADVRDGVIEARQRTLASENDSLYGVHVSSTAITLFAGDAYVSGDPDNTVIELPGSVTATSSLSGGVTAATFTRLTGLPSATGTIVLEDVRSDAVATVTISGAGLVE